MSIGIVSMFVYWYVYIYIDWLDTLCDYDVLSI